MKKLLFLFVLFFLLAQPLAADTSSHVTLADAIYADLATRQALDNVSIYYTDGKAANDVKLNQDRHWLPASTVKTFAAMYAYKLISLGKIHLEDSVTIDSKNEVTTELVTQELPTLQTGDTVSIDRLIRQMITQSDNTAFNQLVDILGRDKITTYIESLGLIHSHVGSKLNLDDSQTQYEYDVPGYGINTTTAADYAKAFELIKNNKIPRAKDLFTVLKDQKINNMIPLYLPKDVVCAHKTGDLNPLFHDGGICQDKKQSYIVTIFTNYGDPTLLAHISQLLYTKDFNLVGAMLQKPSISDIGPDTYPLDPLVMKTIDTPVLGASTLNFSTPDLSPADLGIKPQDLTLTIKDSDLPQIFIPADSALHPLSDVWQITKKAFALGPQARRDVDLETAKLRLAETKDLLHRGKTQEAQAELQTIQQGLTISLKDPTLQQDSTAQNTLEAISETRFTLLGTQIQSTTGEEKLQWIKQTSQAAQKHLQEQANTPVAQNAISPSQKILTGTVINVTDSSYTIKTPGQQIITIPNSPDISIKNTALSQISPTPSETISPEISPSEVISPTIRTTPQPSNPITVGSTIAVAGTQKGETFAASVIVPNVPKEFIAPQPVTVAKVNLQDRTMVTIENGIYIQVNVNKDTIIKGQDTSIPLNEIKPGDVVIVHGEPLTQSQQTIPSVTPQTSPTITLSPQNTGEPTITQATKHEQGAPSVTTTVSISPSSPSGISETHPTVFPTNGKSNSLISPTLIPVIVSAHPVVNTSNKTNSITPSAVPTTPFQPKVIQSTSIQVIEKKQNITQSPSITKPITSPQPPTKAQENKPQQNNQPHQQPAQQQGNIAPTETKKK